MRFLRIIALALAGCVHAPDGPRIAGAPRPVAGLDFFGDLLPDEAFARIGRVADGEAPVLAISPNGRTGACWPASRTT